MRCSLSLADILSRRSASSNEATANILPVVCEPRCHRSRRHPRQARIAGAWVRSILRLDSRATDPSRRTRPLSEVLTDAQFRFPTLARSMQLPAARAVTAAPVSGAVLVTRPVRRVRHRNVWLTAERPTARWTSYQSRVVTVDCRTGRGREQRGGRRPTELTTPNPLPRRSDRVRESASRGRIWLGVACHRVRTRPRHVRGGSS